MVLHLCVRQRGLYLSGHHLEAVRIQQFAEVTLIGRRIFYGKEAVVQTYLGIYGRTAFYPVDRRLGLAVAALGTRLAVGSWVA